MSYQPTTLAWLPLTIVSALSNVQDGISRSYDWVALGIVPTYIVRQFVLTVLMAVAYVAGLPMSAVTAMVVCALSYWLPTMVQLWIMNSRFGRCIAAGPKVETYFLGQPAVGRHHLPHRLGRRGDGEDTFDAVCHGIPPSATIRLRFCYLAVQLSSCTIQEEPCP